MENFKSAIKRKYGKFFGVDRINKFLNELNNDQIKSYLHNEEKLYDDITNFNETQNNSIFNMSFILKKNQLSIENLKKIDSKEFCGLQNIGNTCYFNSLIQILYYFPKYFENIYEIIINNNENNDIYLLKEIFYLFCRLTYGINKFYSPKELLKRVKLENGEIMKVGEQRDINEFSLIFFENISKELKNLKLNKNLLILEGLLQKKVNEKILEAKEKFSFISINIKEKDLYKAIKNSFVFNVKNNNSKMNYYISKFPELLCFHLQRTLYDKETKNYKKDNSSFEIKKIIDMSRYDIRNLDEIKKLKEEIKIQKIKLIEIENNLKKFDNYGESNFNWIDNLKNTIYYIKNNINNKNENKYNNDEFENKDENKSNNDEFNNKDENKSIIGEFVNKDKNKSNNDEFNNKDENKSNIDEFENKDENKSNNDENLFDIHEFNNKDLLNLFENSIKKLKSKYNDLLKEKNDLKNKLKNKYNNLKFKSLYEIYAIIIHQGYINSGHYYNYIKINGEWYKLNDSKVSKISEEIVFLDANSELNSTSNANCIYYIKKEKLNNLNYDFISENIKIEIKKENQEFINKLYKELIFDTKKYDFDNFLLSLKVQKKNNSINNFFPRIINFQYFLYDYMDYNFAETEIIRKILGTYYFKNFYKNELNSNEENKKILLNYKIKEKKLYMVNEIKECKKYQFLLNFYINSLKFSFYSFKSYYYLFANSLTGYLENLILSNCMHSHPNKHLSFYLKNVNLDLCLFITYLILVLVYYKIKNNIKFNKKLANYFLKYTLYYIIKNLKFFINILLQLNMIIDRIKNEMNFSENLEEIIKMFKLFTNNLKSKSNLENTFKITFKFKEDETLNEFIENLKINNSINFNKKEKFINEYHSLIQNSYHYYNFDKELKEIYDLINKKELVNIKELINIDKIIENYKDILEQNKLI